VLLPQRRFLDQRFKKGTCNLVFGGRLCTPARRGKKSQAIAYLSLRFLRLIEDARRISPVQVIGSTDQNRTNSSPWTKPASVKPCALRIMLITRDEHGFSNHQSSCAHQAPAVVLPWTQLPWNPVQRSAGVKPADGRPMAHMVGTAELGATSFVHQ